jgi:hypothetical protein
MSDKFWTFLGDLVDPATWIGAAFLAVLLGLVAWLVGRAVRLAVHRLLEKRPGTVDQTVVRFLAQLARLGVWIFAFLSYAHLVPALQGLGTAWLASVAFSPTRRPSPSPLSAT